MDEGNAVRSDKNAFWIEAHNQFFEKGRRFVRARWNLPAPAKLDTSEIVNSAVESLASFCDRHGRDLSELESLGPLFFAITMGKVSNHLQKLHAGCRDIGKEVSAETLATAAGGAHEPVDNEALTPDEQELLSEAWEHCRALISTIDARIETSFADSPDLIAIGKLVLASDLGEHGQRARIQQSTGRTFYMVDLVVKQIRRWARETWPEEYKEFMGSLRHARETRQRSQSAAAGSSGAA
jgi:hypothetical protein